MSPPAESTAFKPDPNLVALGKRVFFDPRLLEPQGTSYMMYHDLGRVFAPVLRGEALCTDVSVGNRPGHVAARNALSLLYLRYISHRYFFQDDDADFPSPSGGFFADDRANSIPEQIHGPLFNPDEMDNRSARDLQRKAADTDLGEALAEQFGANAVHEPGRLISMLDKALEAYFQSDELILFTSRSGDFLRKRTPLSTAEMRGLILFRNPNKGSYASCHLMVGSPLRPERPLFTDFDYDAIVVPRNPLLPTNKDTRHFGINLYQTVRTSKWPGPDQWCSYFRVAGLHNVAVHQTFMHNDMLHTLRDTVSFYIIRSTDPAQWYPGGKCFGDVSTGYQGNINMDAAPMNRHPDTIPALTEDEIDDIATFLRMLTDAQYVVLMPDPAVNKAYSAHALKAAAKTIALERRSPAGTNMR